MPMAYRWSEKNR